VCLSVFECVCVCVYFVYECVRAEECVSMCECECVCL